MSACFELTDVVVVARTPSSSSPRIYVQDGGGGDFSAVVAKCSSTAQHACPAAANTAVNQLLDGTSVTVRGFYSHRQATGFEEVSILEVVSSGALRAVPPPVRLTTSGAPFAPGVEWHSRQCPAGPARYLP